MIKKDEDVQLMELYKKTMDNVNMSPYKKDEIRDSLVSQTPMVGTKHRTIVRIARYAAVAAAVCAVLLCIPATRTTVSAAIDYLKQTFHLANGGEVIYEESSEGNSISFSITSDDDNGYTKPRTDVSTLSLETPKRISPTNVVLTNTSVTKSKTAMAPKVSY